MIQQIKLLYSIANFMVERDMSLKACIIISVPVGPQMSHWIFRVTSDNQGRLRTRPGRLRSPRETSDTLVLEHIMDLLYITFHFTLNIIILLII